MATMLKYIGHRRAPAMPPEAARALLEDAARLLGMGPTPAVTARSTACDPPTTFGSASGAGTIVLAAFLSDGLFVVDVLAQRLQPRQPLEAMLRRHLGPFDAHVVDYNPLPLN